MAWGSQEAEGPAHSGRGVRSGLRGTGLVKERPVWGTKGRGTKRAG